MFFRNLFSCHSQFHIQLSISNVQFVLNCVTLDATNICNLELQSILIQREMVVKKEKELRKDPYITICLNLIALLPTTIPPHFDSILSVLSLNGTFVINHTLILYLCSLFQYIQMSVFSIIVHSFILSFHSTYSSNCTITIIILKIGQCLLLITAF